MRDTNMDSSQLGLHTERDRPKKAGPFKVRFIIAALAALCPVVCYISRQNLPFAIVSMVVEPERKNLNDLAVARPSSLPDSVAADEPARNGTGPASADGTSARRQLSGFMNHSQAGPAGDLSDLLDANCPLPAQLSQEERSTITGYGPKYEWSADDKGILLGAFFWTYVIAQIPMARLAERAGAKWLLVLATAGSALLSLVSPWAASLHVHLLSLIRVLMGISQAAIYPICYLLYSKWLPPIERSQALAILMAGAYVGSIIASSLTGYFSEQASLGWEWAFYAPGILCLVWTVVWIVYASNEPREHPSISIEELVYIESKMEVQRADLDGTGSRPEMSWSKLFSSRSIWIMIVAFLSSNWSFSVVLMLLPTYLSKILHVTPIQSGIINSIIYVLCCISSPLVGVVSTMMVETRACGLSRLRIRKLFESIALFGQSICFVLIPLLGCSQYYIFAVLFVQIVLFSCVNGGEVQLPTELSVDFAGTIYAIGNCIGSTTGFIVPMVYSQIVRDETSREQWAQYFYVAAAVSAVGGVTFLLFGDNKLQNFARELNESRTNICKLTGARDKGSSFSLELPSPTPTPPPPQTHMQMQTNQQRYHQHNGNFGRDNSRA